MDSELLLIVHVARNLFLPFTIEFSIFHFWRVLLRRHMGEISHVVLWVATIHVLGQSTSSLAHKFFLFYQMSLGEVLHGQSLMSIFLPKDFFLGPE